MRQKGGLMGEWHKVKPKAWSPCDGCEVGHSAYSSKIVDGKMWIKANHCQETCQRYKDWLNGELIHNIVAERHDALLELGKC